MSGEADSLLDLLGYGSTQLAENRRTDGQFHQDIPVTIEIAKHYALGLDVADRIVAAFDGSLFQRPLREQLGCAFTMFAELEGLLGRTARSADEENSRLFELGLDVLSEAMSSVERTGGGRESRCVCSFVHGYLHVRGILVEAQPPLPHTISEW